MIFVLCYNRNNLIKYKENIKEALEEKIDKNKTVKTAHNLPYARMLFIDKEISKENILPFRNLQQNTKA